MLAIKGVQFHYDAKGALYRFDLAAKPGEIIGIVGKSGMGKSTLLDLIAGFQTPQQGNILWDGVEISTLPPEARPLTILFQANNLFEHLSAEQNVGLGISPNKAMTAATRERVRQSLYEVGLDGFAEKTAGLLSGGQKQRVALARSLIRNTPILLLDEPFSGLDDETKASSLALTQKLAMAQNTLVLMVTHDRSDCVKIATRTFQVRAIDDVRQLEDITSNPLA